MIMRTKETKVLLCILLVVFFSFLPVLQADFVNWDDPEYVIDNPLLQSFNLERAQQLFLKSPLGVYCPLTVLSFVIEYKLFGLSPAVYHLHNVLLHLGVVMLIFLFALRCRLTVWAAGFAALLFGVHPMHVESVAWVTERKDLLYAFFYMLSLLSYARFKDNQNLYSYIFSIIWGVLSVLAKPMALSLPLILLLYDWFYSQRLTWRDIRSKIPLCILYIPIVWITYSHFARNPLRPELYQSALIWAWTFSFYFIKFAFPKILIPVYMLPEPVSLLNPDYLIAVLVLAALICSLFILRKNRWILFAFLYFYLSIFFLLRYDGQDHDLNIVADRYMYLPSLGLCLALGYGVDHFIRYIRAKSERRRQIIFVCLPLIFLPLIFKTGQQCAVWQNGISLWSHVLKYYPDYDVALINRGQAFMDREEWDNALNDFDKAAQFRPPRYAIFNNRGMIFAKTGKWQLALPEYNLAIEMSPDVVNAYLNRGNLYRDTGQFMRALADYNKAINLEKDQYTLNWALAYAERGRLYFLMQNYSQALADIDVALAVYPDLKQGQMYRADIINKTGVFNEPARVF